MLFFLFKKKTFKIFKLIVVASSSEQLTVLRYFLLIFKRRSETYLHLYGHSGNNLSLHKYKYPYVIFYNLTLFSVEN